MESGLVGLRAELQKKRGEASKIGVGQRGPVGLKENEKINKKSFNSSNAGVSARAARDAEQAEEERMTEEKARSVLEKKAAMYERLHGGVDVLDDDQLNQKYLINFQKKIVSEVLERKRRKSGEESEKQSDREKITPADYTAKEDLDEWVEYTDAFGRTRECMRKDLPNMLEKDKELKRDLHDPEEGEEGGEEVDPEIMLEDLHRDAQKRRWERQEALNATKKDIHYQDVLFDEARTHGAGFMRFSKDEKERKEQMDFLREMEAETKAGKTAKAASDAKKATAMKARLEKVRQRKRLKMGLPIKEDDKLKTPPASDDEGEDEPTKQEPKPTTLLEPETKKQKTTREWDVGKEDMNMDFGLGKRRGNWIGGSVHQARSSSDPAFSQEEWVNRQRTDRRQEFAPPSSYSSQSNHKFGNR